MHSTFSKVWCAIAILCAACSSVHKEPHKPVIVKNGDVTISYTKAGSGDTSLLFVHGWSINKSFWQNQANTFSKRYTVVTLDLGGHGESGHNRSSWTIDDFANDVTAVIDSLQLKNVILIGHSMSGNVVVETALARPAKVIGIIGIDNLNDFRSSFSAEEQKQTDAFIQSLKENFTATATTFIKAALFPENYPDTVSINRVIASIKQMDTTIATNTLVSLIVYASTEATRVSQLGLPLHLIESDRTPVNADTLNKYCKAGFYAKTIYGTGHYPMIEKPSQFNRLLQETIDDIGKGK